MANVAAKSFFPPCKGVPFIAYNCTNKASARNRARCKSCDKKHKRIKWRESKKKARAKTRASVKTARNAEHIAIALATAATAATAVAVGHVPVLGNVNMVDDVPVVDDVRQRCEAIPRFHKLESIVASARRELRSVQTEAKRLRESLVTVRHELRETLQNQVSLRRDYQTEIQDARLRACEIDKRNTRLQNENKELQQIIAKKQCRIGELTGAHNDDRVNKCELECCGPKGVDKTSDVGGYGDTGDQGC